MGSSRIRDWTRVSCIGRWILYHWATREAPAWRFLKLLLPGLYLYCSAAAGWHYGWWSDALVAVHPLGCGHLGQWESWEKIFLSSIWQCVCLPSLEPSGWNCSFSGQKPANRFWALATSKGGVNSIATTSGDSARLSQVKREQATIHSFFFLLLRSRGLSKNKSHAVLRWSNYSALLFGKLLILWREMLTFL